MKTSETIDKLSAALVGAQSKLKNAAFDKVNPHFRSKYATLSAVRDTVTPALAEAGLAVIQGTMIDAGQFYVTSRIVHTSGQWIESAYPFAISKPQDMGSAMTYARRYLLSAMCNIASEEDDDGNAASAAHDNTPRANTSIDKPMTKGETLALKDALCREIVSFTGALKLRDWAKSPDTRQRIASLHPDFQDVVRNSYLEALNELESMVAA